MNYGLYLSASGALANMFRQDLYANNLANMNTIGFKPDIAVMRHRLPERLESPGTFASSSVDPQLMLERLGGGVFGHPTRISMAQGDLMETGRDLDVALQGEGFLVISPDGDPDEQNLRLTRDGRMTLDAEGRLALSTNGMIVLDVNNLPITLDRSAKIHINEVGDVTQNERVIAKLRITQPQDPSRLRKVGHSLLRLDDNSADALTPAGGRLLQGHLETSATDPIMTLNAMISATKAMQSNATMMQYHDQIIGLTVNTFGRIS
ncbi:MAG: flagellar hook-basal body protein [Planctomycetes bacterium]|nr:flagellar hook-basal body protein [Planctomycetota bacterium]